MATLSQINTWYASLAKPALNPPNSIFGPVWTILYALMGLAAYLVWLQDTKKQTVRRALAVFGLQLALNVLWSFLFFGLHWTGVAFVEILLMWLAILWTIVLFARHSRLAAWLLVPYLLWVTFASYLNYMVWQLN